MSYMHGCVAAVPTANRDAYLDFTKRIWAVFKDLGALSTMECWGDDIPDGTVTDFKKAVKATADESVVLSWMVWPDKATYEAAQQAFMNDERMKDLNMPFDGQRVIWGGFQPFFEA